MTGPYPGQPPGQYPNPYPGPYSGRARRPGGVTLLVVLIVIGGILQVGGGVLLILGHNNATVIREAKTSSDRLLWIGIGAVIVGALYLLLSRGLAHGNGFARLIVGFLSLVSLIGGIWAIVTQHGNVRNEGISSAIVGLIVLLLLYSPKANEFFRTN